MKLLALVESPDHVCCRYRIRPLSRLSARRVGRLTCEGLDRGALLPVDSSFTGRDEFDAVILQRKLLPSWQLSALRRCFASPGFRLRRRRHVPRLVLTIAARTAAGGPGGSPRPSARPIRSSPATTSLRTAALRAGAECRASPRDSHVCRPRSIRSRGKSVAGTARARLDRFVEHASGSRAIATDLGTAGRGASAAEASRDLRPISRVVSASGHSGGLERADRGARDCGRAHRRELDSRRPLEPGKVRAQGLAVPGGGAAGRRQPGRVAP